MSLEVKQEEWEGQGKDQWPKIPQINRSDSTKTTHFHALQSDQFSLSSGETFAATSDLHPYNQSLSFYNQ